MTKKKKPAKKLAGKAKGQAAQAAAAKPSKPPSASKTDGPAPKVEVTTKRDATAKAAPASRSSASSQPTPAKAEPVKAPRAALANGHDDAKAPAPVADRQPKQSDKKQSEPTGKGRKEVKIGAIPDAIAQAAQPLQTFAIEMQRMAKESIEETSEVLERLREARSVEEVVLLQTTFMQQSFRRTTEFAGRISQLMTSSHASLFQQGQAAMRSLRSIAGGM